MNNNLQYFLKKHVVIRRLSVSFIGTTLHLTIKHVCPLSVWSWIGSLFVNMYGNDNRLVTSDRQSVTGKSKLKLLKVAEMCKVYDCGSEWLCKRCINMEVVELESGSGSGGGVRYIGHDYMGMWWGRIRG